MSLYVLDSSVAVKWVLQEVGTAEAISLRNDIINETHEVIAPDVFVSEVAHALTKAERQKFIPVGDAQTHLADILRIGPVFYSFMPLSSGQSKSRLPLELLSPIAFLSHWQNKRDVKW